MTIESTADVTSASKLLATRTVSLRVNGESRVFESPDHELLVDAIRHRLGLTGTHVGCYNGDCGACTVSLNGNIVKSCLILAASVDQDEVVTIEGMSQGAELHPIQQAFWDHDAFQCGFCVPGQLFACQSLLEENATPQEEEIRRALSGNICRCTNSQRAVAAIQELTGSDAARDTERHPG